MANNNGAALNSKVATVLTVLLPDAVETATRHQIEELGHRVRRCVSPPEVLTCAPSADLLVLGMPADELLRPLSERALRCWIVCLGGGEEVSRIGALAAGADDYVILPQSRVELDGFFALLRARLRRVSRDVTPEVRRAGPLQIDFRKRTVTVAGHAIELLPAEYEVLCCLMHHLGEPVARTELQRRIGSSERSRSTYQHICEIRRRFERAQPGVGHLIETVRGYGYAIRGPAAAT